MTLETGLSFLVRTWSNNPKNGLVAHIPNHEPITSLSVMTWVTHGHEVATHNPGREPVTQ